jgi:hypothetical protein
MGSGDDPALLRAEANPRERGFQGGDESLKSAERRANFTRGRNQMIDANKKQIQRSYHSTYVLIKPI